MQMRVAMHNSKVYQEKLEEIKQNQQNLQQQQQQRRGRRRNQQQQDQQQVQKKKVEKPCNCRGCAANCPLGGKCLSKKSIVYTCKVKVTRLDDFTVETYTGLTEGPFKQRLYGHNSNFKKKKQRNRTMLSKYIHPTNKKSGQVKEKASIYELTTFLIRRVYGT